MTMPLPVIVRAHCASCHKPVDLACKGYDGFWGYPSYNEYICPHCEKRNVALSAGTILSARGAVGVATPPQPRLPA